MQHRVGQVGRVEQFAQPGVTGPAGPQRVQHGQAAHPLAQVGAGCLARLRGVAGHVEDVVGQLPGHPDRLAGGLDPVHHVGRGIGEHGPEPPGRGHQRRGLLRHHPQVVLQRVLAGPRADGLGDLPADQPGERLGLDPDRVRAQRRPGAARPGRTGSRRSGSRSCWSSGSWRSAGRGGSPPRPSRRRGTAWPGGSARSRPRPAPPARRPGCRTGRPAAPAWRGTACRRHRSGGWTPGAGASASRASSARAASASCCSTCSSPARTSAARAASVSSTGTVAITRASWSSVGHGRGAQNHAPCPAGAWTLHRRAADAGGRPRHVSGRTDGWPHGWPG